MLSLRCPLLSRNPLSSFTCPFLPSISLHFLFFWYDGAMHDPRPAVDDAMPDPRPVPPSQNAESSLNHRFFFGFFFFLHSPPLLNPASSTLIFNGHGYGSNLPVLCFRSVDHCSRVTPCLSSHAPSCPLSHSIPLFLWSYHAWSTTDRGRCYAWSTTGPTESERWAFPEGFFFCVLSPFSTIPSSSFVHSTLSHPTAVCNVWGIAPRWRWPLFALPNRW